jgi:hypothetical protein
VDFEIAIMKLCRFSTATAARDLNQNKIKKPRRREEREAITKNHLALFFASFAPSRLYEYFRNDAQFSN